MMSLETLVAITFAESHGDLEKYGIHPPSVIVPDSGNGLCVYATNKHAHYFQCSRTLVLAIMDLLEAARDGRLDMDETGLLSGDVAGHG